MFKQIYRDQSTERSLGLSRLGRIIPIVTLIVFGTLFLRHVAAMDMAAVGRALGQLSLWQWIGAGLFTTLSFTALGLYDVIVHHLLKTGVSARRAFAAGVRAIALSQTLGFGLVTSTAVRWRCLPELSALGALRISTVVGVSFLLAMGVLIGVALPLSGLGHKVIGLSAPALLAASLGTIAFCGLLTAAAQKRGWIPRSLRMGTLVAILGATTADTVFAAAALWVLWPDAVSFEVLFAAYLVALGAGLLSNAPGGVGAFDLTLIALLPAGASADGLAALLAFRVIYYAVPALAALMTLIKPTPAPTARHTAPAALTHPEAALAQQSALCAEVKGETLMWLPALGAGAVLGPLPPHISPAALRRSTAPQALYKCPAPCAAKARASGWSAIRVARDAQLDPQTWTTEGPSRRQLRRALRTFQRANLSVATVENPQILADVAQAWAAQHGGERGLSMGRFCPEYLKRQTVIAAFDGPRPVAFVSFHTGPTWTLDLIRYQPDCPTGTLHALICHGIECARAAQATTLSLAAVPAPPAHWIGAKRIANKARGLTQFKSSFGPTWTPLYAAAPGPLRLAITLAALSWRIHNPPPLPQPPSKPAQRNNEDFSFAPPQPL